MTIMSAAKEVAAMAEPDMKSLAKATLKEAEQQYGAEDDMTVVTVRVEERV